jgi:hypothetical protein
MVYHQNRNIFLFWVMEIHKREDNEKLLRGKFIVSFIKKSDLFKILT